VGQLEEDRNPTLAFAHAISALERADTAETRRFALRQLWKGPLAFVRSEGTNGGVSSLSFSTDGEWLADSGTGARVWRRDGLGPFNVAGSFPRNVAAQFAGDGRRLVIAGPRSSGTTGMDVLGLPEFGLLKRIETPGEWLLAVRGDRLITARGRAPNGSAAEIVVRSLTAGDTQILGSLSEGSRRLQIDASGDGYFVSYPGEGRVLTSTLKVGAAGQRSVLRTSTPVSSFWLDGKDEQIALLDDAGALRVGSLAHASELRRLIGSPLKPTERINGVAFDRISQWLVAAFEGQGLRTWDLPGPPDAEPLVPLSGRLEHGADRRGDAAAEHDLYALLGFRTVDGFEYPAELEERRVSNPDSFEYLHTVTVQAGSESVDVIPVFQSLLPLNEVIQLPNFFDALDIVLLSVDPDTGEALRDGNGDLIKYNFGNTNWIALMLRNTSFIIQPEEVLAENFATLMEWRAEGVLPPANPDGFPVNDVDLLTAMEGVMASGCKRLP
jgi:hypothetical protein